MASVVIDYKNDIVASWQPSLFRDMDEYEDYYLQSIRETTPDTIFYHNKKQEDQKLTPIDNFPEFKTYEVWVEGSARNDPARRMGMTPARNFRQACDIVLCTRHLEAIQEAFDTEVPVPYKNEPWLYDPQNLTLNGSKLYWSESQAKKKFG